MRTQKNLGVESSQNISVEAGPTTSKLKESKPWDLPLRLLTLFIESLGRGSEEFYVYLPLADEPMSGVRSRKRGT